MYVWASELMPDSIAGCRVGAASPAGCVDWGVTVAVGTSVGVACSAGWPLSPLVGVTCPGDSPPPHAATNTVVSRRISAIAGVGVTDITVRSKSTLPINSTWGSCTSRIYSLAIKGLRVGNDVSQSDYILITSGRICYGWPGLGLLPLIQNARPAWNPRPRETGVPWPPRRRVR